MKKYLIIFLGAVIGTQFFLTPPAQIISAAHAEEKSGRKVLYWYDPMVPEKRFDKPGKSPFMDMDLVPKYADETDSTDTGGKPVVSINAQTIQKMGVRTATVGKSDFGGGLRTTGIVMPNERAQVNLFSQVEGRVENLKYSAEGDRVKKGEVFYALVSPELSALQNDYITALAGGLNDIATAARKRMALLGVDEGTLSVLAKTRKPFDQIPFHISANGILTKLNIHNGSYLKAGDEIAQIQDLSVVWVEADVSEKDIVAMKKGNSAKVTFPGSTQNYDAKIDYIYPSINADTRTAKVRLVVGNKDNALKPASYATVEFVGAASDRVAVPSEAILRTSTGDHVIMVLGGGKFQARDVQTGTASGGSTEILSGLNEGEEIVTSSQFLIDSESSLNESMEKLAPPSANSEKPNGK